MLQAEREQKAVLEIDRKEQERLLAEAQAKLEQLERDKAAAADKMQVRDSNTVTYYCFRKLKYIYRDKIK
jgi:hypothetical protein